MKVLLLSTFGNYGGAAVCAIRLFEALKKHDIDVDLRVLMVSDDQVAKPILYASFINRARIFLDFALDRLKVLFRINDRKFLYKFSTGQAGINLVRNRHVLQSDIIHLHWVGFSFTSIRTIQLLSKLKPVIWTFHDMWAFTGGCHYSSDCVNFKKVCDDCFYLKDSSLSEKIQEEKLHGWSRDQFKILTTSNWLAEEARSSRIFNKWEVNVLPTPIDTKVFYPLIKDELRIRYKLSVSDYYVLFGAVDLEDERKGFRLLLEAFNILNDRIPNLHLITFGKGEVKIDRCKVTSFGSVSSQKKLNDIYNLSDIFVLPSIQDNLPNTVMEALSCGVPVVSFNSGGVVDMVEHRKNGYIIDKFDPEGLVTGMEYFLSEEIRKAAGLKARKKIVTHFSEEKLIPEYISLYQAAIE